MIKEYSFNHMVSVHIKEHVIYTRYDTGGYSGGSCWNNDEPTYYHEDAPKDKFKVLDLVLAELKPQITYLQYKQIESLIHDNSETEYQYYGNSRDWTCEYIILSDLYKLLETF